VGQPEGRRTRSTYDRALKKGDPAEKRGEVVNSRHQGQLGKGMETREGHEPIQKEDGTRFDESAKGKNLWV